MRRGQMDRPNRVNTRVDFSHRREAWAGPYQRFHTGLLSHTKVHKLSVLRPRRAVFDTMMCWSWICAAWTVVAIWPSVWTALLAIPLISSRYYALFIIGHDGFHRRI